MGVAGKRTVLAAACILVLAGISAAAAESLASPAIGLGSGRQGDYLWSVEARRPEGSPGGGTASMQRPCLLVGTKWQIGPFNFRRSRSRQCAGTAKLTAAGPPLTASGTQPSSGGPPRLTAVGMIFAPAVRRARVTLAGGREMTIRLRRPTPAQAHEAGLERFRYAAFAVRGTWCAERVVSENAGGRVLWDSGVDDYACKSGSGRLP